MGGVQKGQNIDYVILFEQSLIENYISNSAMQDAGFFTLITLPENHCNLDENV